MFKDRRSTASSSRSTSVRLLAHPLDNSLADRFVSLRDPNVFTAHAGRPVPDRDGRGPGRSCRRGQHGHQNKRGWMLTLPPNEKASRPLDL